MARHAETGEHREIVNSLEALYQPIAGPLAEMESCLARELESPHAFMAQYTDHLGHFRGKRLRPAVLFFSSMAVGEVEEAQIEVASAAELMHCATLVHDDILDGAEIRRGVETANVKWGNERSVLLGDYIFTKAFEIVLRQKGPNILVDLIASAQEICLGEMLQIEKRFDFSVDEPFYLSMIGMKTASLFRFCAGAGARLSGGSRPEVEALRTYAGNLGIAFQIIDDCLDLVGEEAVVGKSLGTDVDKGKMTLPLIHALAESEPEARRGVEMVFREGARSQALRDLLEEKQSIGYAMNRAREYVEEGRRSLEILPPSDARDHAIRVGDFILRREW